MLVACIRRLGHQYANKTRRDLRRAQLQSHIPAVRIFEFAGREDLPFPLRSSVEIQGISSVPIFHLIGGCIRISPHDSCRVHLLFALEINYHPLRMERVTFAGELAG